MHVKEDYDMVKVYVVQSRDLNKIFLNATKADSFL